MVIYLYTIIYKTMNKFFIVIIAIFFELLTLNSRAQNVWSYANCVDHAMENNIQIQQSSLSIEQAELNYQQSKNNRLPSVEGSFNDSYSWSKSYENDTYSEYKQSNTHNYSVSASVNIYNGFKINNQIKQDALNLESEKYYSESIKESVELNILNAYLQILYDKEEVNNAEEQIKATSEQLTLAEERFSVGLISNSDYLQIKSELASEKLTLANSKSTLAIDKVSLMQLLELPVSNDFDVVIPNLDEILDQKDFPNSSDVYAIALGIKPQVKQVEYDVQSAMLEEKIVNADRLPSLSLSTGVGTGWNNNYTYSYADQLNNNFSPSVAVGLTIPIFQKNQVKTNIKLARVSVDAAKLEETDTKNTLRKDIEQACVDVMTAITKYEANLENFDAVQESYNVANEKYQQGLINSIDFLVEKTNLITAESDLLQAKYALIFNNKILDFYKGIDIIL